VFVFCVDISVFIYRYRPCDELITRPRVLPTVLDLVTEVKRKVSWRRSTHKLGCRAKGKKNKLVELIWLSFFNTHFDRAPFR
jgi:hypothetical protein